MAMYPVGSFAVAAGADPELQPYPYDPVKAKQLLVEACYPDGFETTIYSYAREDVPEMTRLVEATAGSMAKIGVKLTIFSTEYPVARTRRMNGKIPGHISCLGTPNRSNAGDLLTLINTLHHSSSRLTDHKKVFKNMSCAPDDVPSAGSWRRGSWLRWSASSTHNPSPSGGTGPTTRRSARLPSVSAGGGSRESPPAA